MLASNPRDFNALIGAGRAALELGDVQAAAGFFGRAEEVNPNAPAAKAGLGAAMAHMGDADGAIFYFDQATRLGAQPMTIAARPRAGPRPHRRLARRRPIIGWRSRRWARTKRGGGWR